MTKQLMIYGNAVPLSSEKHRDICVAPIPTYEFARNLNAVPLVAAEVPVAAREYAVVFAGADDAMVPTAILGAGDTNTFVSEDGKWTGKYVPAFLRRYPFVFSRSADGDKYSLCLDEDFEGINRDGRGERLFDSEGERTAYLRAALDFATQYQAQFDATRKFVNRLRELDLFEPAQATIRLPDERQLSLQGFSRVDREKLRGLEDSDLLALARGEALEFIHAHLASLANVSPMAEKLAGHSKPNTGGPSGDQDSEDDFEAV